MLNVYTTHSNNTVISMTTKQYTRNLQMKLREDNNFRINLLYHGTFESDKRRKVNCIGG